MNRTLRMIHGAGLAVCLAVYASVAGLAEAPETGVSMSTVLFDFATAEQGESWMIVNDGVMGGRSQSRFVVNADSTATFSGVVSLENNGGFASVRTRPRDFGLAGCTHIRLRVRGDGNSYQFRLRLDDNFDGVAYQALFTTARNVWQEVTLPVADFRPTFRGRTVRDAPPVDPARIRQVGFLIAEKQEGTFALQIDWIRAEARAARTDESSP